MARAVSAERRAKPIGLRCYPCEGGFTIALNAAVGTSYWLEYYVLGGGGYQESGEASGLVVSQPELIRRFVKAPVIVACVTSISFDGGQVTDAKEQRDTTSLARRTIPRGAVEVIGNDDPVATQPARRTD